MKEKQRFMGSLCAKDRIACGVQREHAKAISGEQPENLLCRFPQRRSIELSSFLPYF
jgi:hypothetical protein